MTIITQSDVLFDAFSCCQFALQIGSDHKVKNPGLLYKVSPGCK